MDLSVDIRVPLDLDGLGCLRAALIEMFACEARVSTVIAQHKVLQHRSGEGSSAADAFASDVLAEARDALCTARGKVLGCLLAGGLTPDQFVIARLAEDYTGAELVALGKDPNGYAAQVAHGVLLEARRDVTMQHLAGALIAVCRQP